MRGISLLAGPLLACSVLGCRSVQDVAHVDDRTGGTYRLVAVDGRPVQRASHPLVTVVPEAIVEPGSHAFTVTRDDADDAQTFVAQVDSGRRYRIAEDDGELRLTESN